jgi:hypothetical protein
MRCRGLVPSSCMRYKRVSSRVAYVNSFFMSAFTADMATSGWNGIYMFS